MTESECTGRLCQTLAAAGAVNIAMVAGMFGKQGLPDRLVLHCSFHGFIEAKRRGCNPTPVQLEVHEQCITRGFPVVVAKYDEVEQLCKLQPSRGRKGVPTRGVTLALRDALSRQQRWGQWMLEALAAIRDDEVRLGFLAPTRFYAGSLRMPGNEL